MNTRLSECAWVDCTNVLPLGELRGVTKLIKTTEDARKYAAEQSVPEDEAVKAGIEQKAREFSDRGAELYTNA